MLAARKPAEFIPEIRKKSAYRPARQHYPRHHPWQKPVISKEAALFCALILILIITGVGLVGTHGRVLAVNYRMQQVKMEISRIQEDRAYLNLELKRLSSLGRIEYIAKTELGMLYPEGRQWLFLSSHDGIDRNGR